MTHMTHTEALELVRKERQKALIMGVAGFAVIAAILVYGLLVC